MQLDRLPRVSDRSKLVLLMQTSLKTDHIRIDKIKSTTSDGFLSNAPWLGHATHRCATKNSFRRRH